MHTASAGLLRLARSAHTRSARGRAAGRFIEVTRLLSASATWGRAWDYPVATEPRDGARAAAAVSTGRCAHLLGAQHQSKMQPNIIVSSDDRAAVLTESR